MPQSLAKAYLHIVFSTKNREPTITRNIQSDLHRVIGGIANDVGCHACCIGGVEDHVHILLNLGRTITIADAVSRIKSNSSAWVNESNRLSTRFQWQNGYGAFSISHSLVDSVRRYIDGQEEHHKTVSFQDEYRNWLRKYEIEWDERYVWD